MVHVHDVLSAMSRHTTVLQHKFKMKWLGAHCIHPPLSLGETVSLITIKSYINVRAVILYHKFHMIHINLRSLSLCLFTYILLINLLVSMVIL